jgi:hypothetical protein
MTTLKKNSNVEIMKRIIIIMIIIMRNNSVRMSSILSYFYTNKSHPLDRISKEDGSEFNCPLTWWRVNQLTFPIIAHLAQKLLCIPATSALLSMSSQVQD